MTCAAIRRSRLQPVLGVTGKTYGVGWRRLERALLQPERVLGKVLWGSGYVLFIRLTLRLISLVAHRTAFRIAFFGLALGLLG